MSDQAAGSSPWVLATEPASLGEASGLVTLVAGTSFCVCGRGGDIRPGTPQGVYFADMRVLSSSRLSLDNDGLEPLAVEHHGGWGATFVTRPQPTVRPRPGLLVLRHRAVGPACREVVEVRNHLDHTVRVTLRLDASTDFADLFAVKENRIRPRGERSTVVEHGALLHRMRDGRVQRQVRLVFEGGDEVDVDPEGATWHLTVPAKGRASVSWHVAVAVGEHWVDAGGHRHHGPGPSSRDAERFAHWRRAAPHLVTDDDGLFLALRRSIDDLGSLRLFDPTDDDALPVVAAGAPWFMALFGRDALLTSLMALPVDPTLALGVLRALARLQGSRVDPVTEEEPGRILHETRYEEANALTLDAGGVYYGSADATPLFVVVLGALSRWGLPDDDLLALLPHADRALEWIRTCGDRDGDGYVEYRRATESGLANQGWKDSWDGVRHHDGRVAQAPIALCEVQGYVHAAYVARAGIARRLGDTGTADRYETMAADLRAAFDRDFWCEDLGWYAMGLDADKRPIDALASNMGHCLWSGIVPPERVAAVVDRLMGDEMWTGFGIRTLAADEPAFDPLSYHCGSVWPHDNAVIAMGFARVGSATALDKLVAGMLDAASAFGGRLPELFCGLDRSDVATPVPFPTSCSPQAWAAATPIALLQAVLGLEVDLPAGVVRVAPRLPRGIDRVLWRGVRTFAGTFDVEAERGGDPLVTGLPAGIRLELGAAGSSSAGSSAAGSSAAG